MYVLLIIIYFCHISLNDEMLLFWEKSPHKSILFYFEFLGIMGESAFCENETPELQEPQNEEVR